LIAKYVHCTAITPDLVRSESVLAFGLDAEEPAPISWSEEGVVKFQLLEYEVYEIRIGDRRYFLVNDERFEDEQAARAAQEKLILDAVEKLQTQLPTREFQFMDDKYPDGTQIERFFAYGSKDAIPSDGSNFTLHTNRVQFYVTYKSLVLQNTQHKHRQRPNKVRSCVRRCDC